MRDDIALYAAYEDTETTDASYAEKELMRAILKSAMDDVRKGGEAHREARIYMLKDDLQYIFSFLSICEHLNLCPLTVRRVCGVNGLSRQAS